MRLLKYLFQYRIRDMKDLLANEKKEALACSEDLEGKTVILSGATAGIGLETARLFAELGAQLILLNRNPEKSENLERELKDKFNCSVETIIVDFSSMEQVRRCGERLLKIKQPLDVLIHNAGVFNTKKEITGDGLEMVFQVNHLGAFLLNYMLRERLKREGRARILYVNSEGHRFALGGVHVQDLLWKRHLYTGLKSYGAAKTAQLLTMRRFAAYFEGSGVTVNAMHPGNVTSDMGNNNGPLYRWMKKKLVLSSAKSPVLSARALHYLAASPDVAEETGHFFNLTSEEEPAPHGRDESAVQAIWEKSLELCALS